MSVFLCYRREDSAAWAGRLCEHLNGIFGPGQVFMDVQDISPGQDFAEAIENTISECQAVVVVIGPRWLDQIEERSGRDDYVRHEVATALRRRVPVIPVLMGGAAMPPVSKLPGSLVDLASRQALEIRDARFADDARVLVEALRRAPGLAHARPRRPRWPWAVLVAVLACATAGILIWKVRPAVDVSGAWIAEMQKPGQPRYRVRLDFHAAAGALTGTVAYPTGSAAIRDGAIESGHLRFSTTHVPQFATQAATIHWTGTVEPGALALTAADDNGVASGMAKRAP